MMLSHRFPAAPAIRATAVHLAATACVGAAVLALLAGCIWIGSVLRAQAVRSDRDFALVRSEIVVGLSRADCYRWLRRHRLVATNVAFSTWRHNALGVWYRSGDGAWPEPPTTASARRDPHPDAEIRISYASIGTCGMTVIEQLEFNAAERIANITANIPFWSCR